MFTVFHRAAVCFGSSNRLYRHIIAVLFIGTATITGMWLPFSKAVGQQQKEEERLIQKRSDFLPPVKITLVKTKKGAIKFEEKFLDNDEWLKGLTVRVANASGKTVTHIDVEIAFSRPENQAQERTGIWHLQYGFSPLWFQPEEDIPSPRVQPILPGDTTELTLSDQNFDEMKLFLKETKYPASIKKIELRVIVIGFSDGTVWNVGHMYRRDRKAPRGWRTIEPEAEQSHGSARHRTGEFFRINLNSFGGGASPTPVNLISQF